MSARPVAHIDQSTCDGCSNCTVSRICPRDAVVLDPAGVGPSESGGHSLSRLRSLLSKRQVHAWKVKESRCSGCLLCAPYCPHQAVVPRERGRAA
jgi:Pyruvate/2-oxoacid:ferredoxin oxidoreductase delta subunit